ncbi:Spy/CpxP family protein refolding chaperone [Ferribacterium limneticum]|uniref:Spy/CpxP family protein refolding chaperone n=1 Tax=Ferribacterium limneticum TaxID=76259 RepID=UPI001CFB80A8|nr:Spy/CpxP family protein refolding chaperone [Ferribacterium limneticum]UCV18751.1 Spy/CpxP family protein refolding chaperone [Ferribacterium limneticum]
MKTTPNSNIKRFLIAASVALAIPLSAAAFGGHGSHAGCSMEAHGGPGHHMMGGNMLPPHLRGLNLTEAQQDKVFEIMHAQAPVMRDKAKALRKAESDLRALTSAADYSEAKARALADEAAKAMSEMTLARAKADRQVFEVLTPEQRKQMAEAKPTERGPRGRGDGPRGAAADAAKPAGR